MALGKRIQESEERQGTEGTASTREVSDMEAVPESASVNFVGEGRANVVFELTGVEGHPGLKGMAATFAHDGRGCVS